MSSAVEGKGKHLPFKLQLSQATRLPAGIPRSPEGAQPVPFPSRVFGCGLPLLVQLPPSLVAGASLDLQPLVQWVNAG